MGPFLVLLFLVAVLIPSCLPDSDEDQDVGSLSTHLPEIQEEIVGKHNELRKSVSPSASNMLKMRWTSEPYENTQKWAENYAHSISAFRRTSVQVVWYSSFLTGCGVAYCPEKSSKYFMVCRYCPAGNYLSRYYVPYDEGEPCASCPDHCDDGLCTNSCDYEDSHAIFHVLAEQGYWGGRWSATSYGLMGPGPLFQVPLLDINIEETQVVYGDLIRLLHHDVGPKGFYPGRDKAGLESMIQTLTMLTMIGASEEALPGIAGRIKI
uniref:Cysteine-rich secretory protein 3-like n=1 Tax=Castor canadensis TaxID=51338 RepID=A0A8B7V2Q1_CASCN|nr:cysteine-rich secretory protein 3-like [Castor canadensis]